MHLSLTHLPLKCTLFAIVFLLFAYSVFSQTETNNDIESLIQETLQELYENDNDFTATTTTTKCRITGTGVRYRTGPDTKYRLLGQFNNGQQVTKTGTRGSWVQLSVRGRTVYTFGKYVSCSKSFTKRKENSWDTTRYFITAKSRANFRSEPWVKSQIIGKLRHGTSGKVISAENGWVKLQSGRQTGYVSGDLAVFPRKPSDGFKTAFESPDSTYCRVTYDGVSLHQGPGTDYDKVPAEKPFTLNRGEIGIFISESFDGWSKLYFRSRSGYVRSDFINCEPVREYIRQSSRDDMYLRAIQFITNAEGACQDGIEDSGNYINGKRGYTCIGVTPLNGYTKRRRYWRYALRACQYESPENFVKCAYDENKEKFKLGAIALYEKEFFGICDGLPNPIFTVCVDISVNSGPGKAREFVRDSKMRECSHGDLRGCSTKLNDRHRMLYEGTPQMYPKKLKYLKGWRNRADERMRFILNY